MATPTSNLFAKIQEGVTKHINGRTKVVDVKKCLPFGWVWKLRVTCASLVDGKVVPGKVMLKPSDILVMKLIVCHMFILKIMNIRRTFVFSFLVFEITDVLVYSGYVMHKIFTSSDFEGVIAAELGAGTETEQGVAQAIIRSVVDFKRDPWPKVSDSAKDLVRKMLNPDPKKCLTAQEVLGKLEFSFNVNFMIP
ncbi:hypothetical protein POM88_021048 [Heracleum sosnowskyi]|uniref:Protein kinase domain-containing protein n=1 Tax=Heracleum sosnowskyi TaxID=360622 RepID=A0AAD8MTF3_9APIA|nr:hypothetical protein POM88_021048 [Heracleum sosnowskyi]